MNPFDPADLGRGRDPYQQLAELRRENPVLRLANGFLAITGSEAAAEVLRDRSFMGPRRLETAR